MFNKAAEKTTALLIFIGAPLTTLFLVTDSVTDPVNVTKLVIAGGVGIGLLAIFLFFNLKETLKSYKAFIILTCLFLAASVNAVINSSSPLTQNVYGSYGRNTGFIAYLMLACIGLGALNLRDSNNFKKLILSLQFAGLVNVLYCAWVLTFGDFIGWSNPYGSILGLFGNPDFISAFLGIFITSLLAIIVDRKTCWRIRVLGLVISLLAFYEIVKSHAIQGIVVTAGGIAIVGFFAVKTYFKNNTLTWIYSGFILLTGLMGILGTLQKGPLAFVYKVSVSLRGEYWRAGIKMGLDHPLTGVGMDSYGDWYRRTRSLHAATVLPGPKVFTNASHNVVIDFFSYGGFPLLLSYVGLLLLAVISIVRVIRRTKEYDSTFVAMVATWACYEVQSIISINQIGLAIWGWLITGALVAYEFATRSELINTNSSDTKLGKNRTTSASGVFSPQLIAGLGIIIGLLLAVPPMSADSKWRAGISSKDANRVISALQPGYMSPSDSSRYAQAVQLFVGSNLMDQAHTIAITGVKFNPEYFDAWRIVYALQNSSPAEKAEAVKNMKRLDPLNADVTAP